MKFFIITFLYSVTLYASEKYTSGPGALQLFDETGMQATPLWIKIWMVTMTISFLSSIIFIKEHLEARFVLAGFLSVVILHKFLTHIMDLPALSGLISALHILCWTPALFFLLYQKHKRRHMSSPYSKWSSWMIFVISFSFFFDIKDAWIYIQHTISLP